jgi:hypothetical protein
VGNARADHANGQNVPQREGEEEEMKMNMLVCYLWVALGVVVSVVLPLIRALLPKPPKALRGENLWQAIRPYAATALFALLTAVLILAAMGAQLTSWATALIAGYTWDSTLQKLTTGNAAVHG